MPTPIHCERLRATSSRSAHGQKNSRMVIRTAAALASATAQPKAPIPMLCDHRPQKAFCSRRRVQRRGRAALQGRVPSGCLKHWALERREDEGFQPPEGLSLNGGGTIRDSTCRDPVEIPALPLVPRPSLLGNTTCSTTLLTAPTYGRTFVIP
jgi:hypothetical protein